MPHLKYCSSRLHGRERGGGWGGSIALMYQRSNICSPNISLLFLPRSSFSLFRSNTSLKLAQHKNKGQNIIYRIELQKKRKGSKNNVTLRKNCHKRAGPTIYGKSLKFCVFLIFPFRCWWWFKCLWVQILTLRDSDTGLRGERPKCIQSDKMEQQKSKMNFERKQKLFWQRVIRFLHFFLSILYNIHDLRWLHRYTWTLSVCFSFLCSVDQEKFHEACGKNHSATLLFKHRKNCECCPVSRSLSEC